MRVLSLLILVGLVSFRITWIDTDSGLLGFRLYKIDAEGNGTQVGTDIAPDLRMVTVSERKGFYTYAVTAFDAFGETDYSEPLLVQVGKNRVRELD